MCCLRISDASGVFLTQNYLEKFGYIEPPKNGTAALRSQHALIDAVKEFQRFAGLKVTGKLRRSTPRLAVTTVCLLARLN